MRSSECSANRGNIAIVDDDDFMRSYLAETLVAGGYRCRVFSSGAFALDWLASGSETTDLLLSDINMPGMNGIDLLRTVKVVMPSVPFILISGLCDLPMADGALRAGATDYLLKPVRPADLLALVSKHVNGIACRRLLAVKEALSRANLKSNAAESKHLEEIFDGLGFKRFETLQHSKRVAAFSLLIARDLNLDAEAQRVLELGSLLHDIGKAGIPHNVLMKPGKLNETEWRVMKMHPQLGMELLQGLPSLAREAQIVYSHHERFDGSGYPQQLAGDAVPLFARIFAVADTLDAMTSNRVYAASQGLETVRGAIRRGAGAQFDPVIAGLLDHVSDQEIEQIQRQFPDITPEYSH